MLNALVFDVDGTLADTEEAHRRAFNAAFAELGLDWHWDVGLYTRLLEVSGGKERIRAYWDSRGDLPQELDGGALSEAISRIHETKTAVYEQALRDGQVEMRPGVLSLMAEAAAAGVQLAIATTTSPVNITGLLKRWVGPDWQSCFSVIEDASTAPRKKPDPMVYLQTLRRLGLAASDCMAFEDSANGLRAAHQAGLATVVTPNAYTSHHDFSMAFRVLPDLDGVTLEQLHDWHTQALSL